MTAPVPQQTQNPPAVVEKKSAAAARHLARERQEFVQWIHNSIASPEMRKLAIQEAAYYFTDAHYRVVLLQLYETLQETQQHRMKLLELSRKHRLQLHEDFEQYRLTIAKLGLERVKVFKATKALLTPPMQQEMEKVYLEDKREMTRQLLDQHRKRDLLLAATEEASERARLRSQFVEQIKQEYDDPDLVDEAIDQYDRSLHAFVERGR